MTGPADWSDAGEIGQPSEDMLVLRSVGLGDDVRVLRARAAVLNRTLQGTECLGPETVFPAIPEQKRRPRHACDRHGAPGGGADAVREWDPVLEAPISLVTRAARHTTVGAESRVEEQPPPEIRGSRVVGDAIRRISRE